jgi:hypothetical protein
MHPEARRVAPGLHTALLQALHGAPERGPVRNRARLPQGHDLPGLVRELGRSPLVDSNELFDIATSFASGEEAVGAIFDGKKGKRVTTRPRRVASPRSPSRSTSGARKERSRATRRASSGATTKAGTKPLLLTQLDGVLEWPLEAPACLTTC